MDNVRAFPRRKRGRPNLIRRYSLTPQVAYAAQQFSGQSNSCVTCVASLTRTAYRSVLALKACVIQITYRCVNMIFLQLSAPAGARAWSVDEGLTVRILRGVGPYIPTTGLHRISPLFPLYDDGHISVEVGSKHVHFFAHHNPYRVLARLVNSGATKDAIPYYGIGLASIVVVTDENGHLPTAIDDFADELIASEHWSVTDGTIRAIRHSPSNKGLPDGHVEVPNVLVPGDEPTAIFEEFFLSLGLATRRAATYTPTEVVVLRGFEEEVRDLMDSVAFLNGSATRQNPPDELSQYDLNDGIVREQLYQQAIDKVVQLNSSLSYVISQAFRGAPPILQSAPLIQRHSLLGVGRAHRAITNIVREIESAFHAQSIRASIYEGWASWPSLKGFNDARSEIDPSTWGSQRLPDVLLKHTPTEDQHKLTYFSGRLGFRESEYAVVAAIQSLAGGDSPHWHISTMTHEVLHGHVREVLQAIFDKVKESEPDNVTEFWQYVFARFRLQMREGCGKDWTLLDSARHLILQYVCLVPRMGSLTRRSAAPEAIGDADQIGEIAVPRKDEQLLGALEHERRNITEIMVHTLDLFYFFGDDRDRYLQVIWRSWESVPSVMRDTRQYVLRSLLACASLEEGDPIDRFIVAISLCARVFQRISDDGPHAIINRAHAIIELSVDVADTTVVSRSAAAAHPLFPPFLCALPIVDLTRHCIASESVKDRLFGSDIDAADDPDAQIKFSVPDYQFVDMDIESAAEFAAYRAGVNFKHDRAANEKNAAWLFLACGNIPHLAAPDGVEEA
jgi:hypothetical protein